MYFPKLKFALDNNIAQQLAHISSEFTEVVSAYVDEPPERLAEELADLAISAITGLHILEPVTGLKAEEVLNAVKLKNLERGYVL